MFIVDANVLLYCVNESAPRHRAAKRWVERHLNGAEPVGLAWISLMAFLRIATLPAMSPRPIPVADAVSIVEDWLAAPAATVVNPTSRHLDLLRGLLMESGTAGNLTNDAHLAALAVEHGARVCTFDRDFARFAGIALVIPEG
jgi:toxin-antitoxin system PIN domain toxin